MYSCYPEWHEICLSLLQEEAAITPIDIDGRNVLMLLLVRYADICRKYYQARNEFIDGYNCRPFEAEDIFQRLCKDKQEMLNCLFNQKDLPLIINQKDNQGKTTLAYFKTLVSEMNKYYDSKQAEIVKLLLSLIPKVDKDTERQIVHMLLDWMPQSDENMQAVRALISQVPSVDQDEKEAIVKMLIHVG